MKLHEKIQHELLNIIGHAGQRLVVSDGPRTVHCEIFQSDAMAVSVDELSLQTDELASAQVDQLRAASGSLCKRLTYLLEPISPIETDVDGCVVQMRSNPPQLDDNGRRYYELLLRRGGSVMLCRYEKQSGSPRIRVPATLTHEVIRRLVQDFDEAVDEVLAG